MSARPQVSVVLIFLDAEAFLDEAIASVVAQSLGEWELLLVDDGSSDGGTGIAQRWAGEMAERIRYLAHEGHRNLGMSASRNLGLNAARGDLVTFLDADDVLLPHALRNLVDLLDAAPRAAMAYAPVEYWYDWAPERHHGRRNFVQRLGVPAPAQIEPPGLLVRFLRRRAAAPSGVMVRTEAARLVGGFEQAFRGMYEDQAFCAKICLRWPVATGAVAGYRYRQHERSSSSLADRSGQHEYGREAFLGWLGDYLRREGMDDGAVAVALRRERWWLAHPRAQKIARRLRRAWRQLLGIAGRAPAVSRTQGR